MYILLRKMGHYQKGQKIMSTNLTQDAVTEIAPLAERILSLRAAANFKGTVAEIRMNEGDVYAAQVASNKSGEYLTKMNDLFVQARAIARKHGTTLPGIKGLEAIAATIE